MTTPLLPPVASLDEYERIRHDTDRFRPGAEAICAARGLGGATIERLVGGSLPVFAVGDALVLKLYPPFEHLERNREAAALHAAEGRLSIPTPGVRGAGEIEGWAYLLMDRLRGRSLAEVWPILGRADRQRLAAQLGEALAALHAIRGPELDPLVIDWPAFVEDQRATAVERQRSRGLEERWCEQIPDFLDRFLPLRGRPGDGRLAPGGTRGHAGGPGSPGVDFLDRAPADTLLHTEIMQEHLLVEPDPGGWRLSGLFDFEPAMVGAREYEFVAVGLFVSGGEAEVFRAVLSAYGPAQAWLVGNLPARLMAWCLLHRYSHLRWFLERVPPPERARRLEDLAEAWWGVSGPESG